MKKHFLIIPALLICLMAGAQDTARFNMGAVKVIVIDPDKSTEGKEKIEIEFPESWEHSDSSFMAHVGDEHKSSKGNKRIAHYAGFEMGMNGYLTKGSNMDFEDDLFDLDLARSYSFNFNFMEHKLPIFKGYAGLVTGMGLTWNSYSFANNTTLIPSSDGISTTVNTDLDYSRNKLRATYLKVPLMLELNSSLKEKKSFHLAVGAEAGVRIGSKTIQHYKQNNDDVKLKVKGPYNLNPFRINALARVGYRNFTVFANYALTSLFEDGKGPELYPFEIGIRLVDF